MTVQHRSRLSAVLALAVFVGVAWWWPTVQSPADCLSPTLSVTPAQGAPGTTVTISGQNWYEGCYDPSSPAATYAPPPRPDSDIRVTFSDGRTVFEVARVTPSGNGTFSFQAQVPDGAQPTNDGSFRADGTNGSPTAGFAVGPKAPPPTTPPAPPATATTRASTATSASVSGSSAGSRASSAAPAASSVDFGTVTPGASTTSIAFNPSTPLAPQVTQATLSPFTSSILPSASPPVTLTKSGNSRKADLLWVLGFLLVGAGAAVAYFLYQRRTSWRPRRF